MTKDKLPEDTRDDMNKNAETEVSLEQAIEAVCFHFDTALYLSQFPELNEKLESHIAGWVANNPQYVEALEKMVNSLAAQLELQVFKVDALVGEPYVTEDKSPKDTSADINKSAEDAASLEQAREAVCFHFYTALYLSQFPELNEQLESHIANWIANNPQYVEALEKMVHSLAAQLDLQVSKVDALVAQPLLEAYNLCGNGLGKCPPAEPDVTSDCESDRCSVSPRP